MARSATRPTIALRVLIVLSALMTTVTLVLACATQFIEEWWLGLGVMAIESLALTLPLLIITAVMWFFERQAANLWSV